MPRGLAFLFWGDGHGIFGELGVVVEVEGGAFVIGREGDQRKVLSLVCQDEFDFVLCGVRLEDLSDFERTRMGRKLQAS